MPIAHVQRQWSKSHLLSLRMQGDKAVLECVLWRVSQLWSTQDDLEPGTRTPNMVLEWTGSLGLNRLVPGARPFEYHIWSQVHVRSTTTFSPRCSSLGHRTGRWQRPHGPQFRNTPQHILAQPCRLAFAAKANYFLITGAAHERSVLPRQSRSLH